MIERGGDEAVLPGGNVRHLVLPRLSLKKNLEGGKKGGGRRYLPGRR